MVKFNNLNDVMCNEFTGTWTPCDYFVLRRNHNECGNCPLTVLGQWFVNGFYGSDDIEL